MNPNDYHLCLIKEDRAFFAPVPAYDKYVCANGGAIYTRITDADLALVALTSQE